MKKLLVTALLVGALLAPSVSRAQTASSTDEQRDALIAELQRMVVALSEQLDELLEREREAKTASVKEADKVAEQEEVCDDLQDEFDSAQLAYYTKRSDVERTLDGMRGIAFSWDIQRYVQSADIELSELEIPMHLAQTAYNMECL